MVVTTNVGPIEILDARNAPKQDAKVQMEDKWQQLDERCNRICAQDLARLDRKASDLKVENDSLIGQLRFL